MERLKNILYNVTFFFNCFLLFLVIFYNLVEVPSWIQVFGRMHPLVLHFPVVLLIIYIIWALWISQKYAVSATGGKLLLLAAAFTSVITALMGLLLSKEEGYDPEALALHKWSGIALSFVSFIWCTLDMRLAKHRVATTMIASLVFILLLITGDLGAGITHGEDYLLGPVLPADNPKQVNIEEAIVFDHMVQPILNSKCVSCHSEKKAKGELIMETAAQLWKGGKDGPILDTVNAELSLMLQRIHLPEEDKKHMPPKGKPQLTEEETDVIYHWIKRGADLTMKVISLPPSDTLRLLANAIFKKPEGEVYDFKAADESLVSRLNNNNRVVSPIALNSPALTATFYNAENYSSESLKDLSKIKGQLVALDLAHMPVKDEDITTIAEFTNLRNLNLNFTFITGKNFSLLSKLPHLKELSISGTSSTINEVKQLASIKSLKRIFAWNTAVTENDAVAFEKLNDTKNLETGFKSDTLIMKLNPPVLQNEEPIITQKGLSLKLKHYINGVEIRYTLDGSDPDSVNSPLYNNNVVLTKSVSMKAKAYKKGWISSDVLQTDFYKSTYTPDSVALLTPVDAAFAGERGKTLKDHVKSELDFRNGKWLGYHGTKMDILLLFNDLVKTESLTLSSMIDIGSYLMPPQYIEIWGGNDPKKLKLLSRQAPKQPGKAGTPYLLSYNFNYAPVEVRYIKISGMPVEKLPKWHQGKGEKGWFFVDEIFVN